MLTGTAAVLTAWWLCRRRRSRQVPMGGTWKWIPRRSGDPYFPNHHFFWFQPLVFRGITRESGKDPTSPIIVGIRSSFEWRDLNLTRLQWKRNMQNTLLFSVTKNHVLGRCFTFNLFRQPSPCDNYNCWRNTKHFAKLNILSSYCRHQFKEFWPNHVPTPSNYFLYNVSTFLLDLKIPWKSKTKQRSVFRMIHVIKCKGFPSTKGLWTSCEEVWKTECPNLLFFLLCVGEFFHTWMS